MRTIRCRILETTHPSVRKADVPPLSRELLFIHKFGLKGQLILALGNA